MNLRDCTVRINAALGPCGVQRAAFYFFESSAEVPSDLSDLTFAAWPLAFVAEEEDFGHSLVVCPNPLQKRQRLLVNLQVRSAAVSLPSFPSLSLKSDILLSEF